MLTTLFNFVYLCVELPFKRKIINFLEITNEIILTVALYQIMMFSDLIDNVYIKYEIGWSLNIVVMIQLGINTIVISVDSMRNLAIKSRRKC